MHIFKKCGVEGILQSGLSYFYDPKPSWAEVDKCYGFPCTAPDNALVYDSTGDLLQNSKGGYILPNNSGIAWSDCIYNAVSQSYTCPNTSDKTYEYTLLSFESLDIDSLDRTIAPVEITSSEISTLLGGFYNKLNSF